MGLDSAAILFLTGAKARGVVFSETVTLGRQSFFPEAPALGRVLRQLGSGLDAGQFIRQNQFADEFFRLLGARSIRSIDYSGYEQATLIHDMNQPLPDSLRETATVAYDGGTLEHVFNITQAFKNSMELVKVGGHFIQVNEANNFLGHGFWQFSPELLFRMFTPDNGFQIEAVLLHEAESRDRWFRVSDPEEVRSRVQLCNCRPTYILTIAKRIAPADIFARPPIQSDYVPVWAGGDPNAPLSLNRPGGVRRLVPSALLRFFKPLLIDNSLFGLGWDKPYYRRLTAESIVQGRF
jgi:hypothetical protein